MWLAALPLSGRVCRQTSAAPSAPEVSGKTLVAIGSFLIGLYFLIEYGAKAAGDAATLMAQTAKQTDEARLAHVPVFMSHDWATFTGDLIVALLGMGLAFRARGVAKLFGWLRHAGQGARIDPSTEKEAAS